MKYEIKRLFVGTTRTSYFHSVSQTVSQHGVSSHTSENSSAARALSLAINKKHNCSKQLVKITDRSAI